ALLAAGGSALVLALGAAPIARLVLSNEALTPLLQSAALTAGALVLYQMLSGAAVGLLDFRALLLLSAVSGVAMVVVLGLTAHYSPQAMLLGYAATLILGVIVALWSSWSKLRP